MVTHMGPMWASLGLFTYVSKFEFIGHSYLATPAPTKLKHLKLKNNNKNKNFQFSVQCIFINSPL